MKKMYLITGFLAIAFSMITMATEKTSTIEAQDPVFSLTGAGAAPHSTQDSSEIYFTGLKENARLVGNVAINIVPYGSDETDSLSVWVRTFAAMPSDTMDLNGIANAATGFRVGSTDVVLKTSYADSIVIVDQLDWVNGALYTYPITAPFGPGRGLIVYARYTNQDGVSNTANVVVFATIQ